MAWSRPGWPFRTQIAPVIEPAARNREICAQRSAPPWSSMASFSRSVMMIAFRAGDDLLAGVAVVGGAREGRAGDEVYDERGSGRSDRQPSAHRNPRNPRTVHSGDRHHALELVVHGPLLPTLGMPGPGHATGLALTSPLARGRAGRARNYPGRCPGLRYWSSRSRLWRPRLLPDKRGRRNQPGRAPSVETLGQADWSCFSRPASAA